MAAVVKQIVLVDCDELSRSASCNDAHITGIAQVGRRYVSWSRRT
jgi:hypothetical protein